MIDVDYLRKVFSEYTTEDLIKYLLVETDDFVPEAIAVMSEEYRKREGDIAVLIEKETLESGVNEFVIDEVAYIKSSKKGDVVGRLYLTSKGIYFIPVKHRNQILPYGFFAHQFGLLGVILDELAMKLSDEASKHGADSGVKNRDLPLSLLTRYIEFSYGKMIERIKSVSYWKSGTIAIVATDDKADSFGLDKANISCVESWISTHNIPATLREGFLKSMLRKLGLCKKDEV